MVRVFQVGIVGCGNIAGGFDERSDFQHAFTHAGAIRFHPRFELRAVAEPCGERRDAFQSTWQVPNSYSEYNRMLENETFDLLCVCTPDHLHADVILAAVSSGRVRAILTEKPLADSLEEAERVIEACRSNQVALYVNYNRLWDPLHFQVKQQIAAGRLGCIQGGVGYYVRGLMHNGTTMISTLRYLLGEEVESVQAFPARDEERLDAPCVDGILTFTNGARTHLIAADKGGYGHSTFEIDLMGNKGRIQLHDNGFQARWSETAEYKRYPGVRELVPSPADQPVVSAMDRTLLFTLDEVANHLDQGIVTQESAEQAVGDIVVAEALLRSYYGSGERVEINHPMIMRGSHV